MTIDPVLLKSFLEEIMSVKFSDVLKLVDYLEGEKYNKGTILRSPGEVENQAFLVLKGTLAIYCPQNRLIRPFFAKEVAFDMDAYFSKSPSETYLVVKENAKLIKVSRDAEATILSKLKHFKTFSNALILSAKNSNQKWMRISQMHYSKAIPLIKKDYKHFFRVFNNTETASLLKVSRRTLSRYSTQQFYSRRSFSVRALEEGIFNYPFPSECHPQVDHVHSFALEWAINHKLFFNRKTRLTFDIMKMPALSCRLYPEVNLKKAIWLGKFFVLLFFMDDYTDKLAKGKKSNFWRQMLYGFKSIVEENKTPSRNGKINLFWCSFQNLWIDFMNIASEEFLQIFKESFCQYIKANIWEAENLDLRRIPSIKEYVENRPLFSGGNLALDFSLFAIEDITPDIYQHWEDLRNYTIAASNLIFKSNDLLSYQKEKLINDHHNLVSLLQIYKELPEDEAINEVIKEHKSDLEFFLEMDDQLSESYSLSSQNKMLLMKSIKYQVSGAVYWSLFDTKRYIDF